MVQDNSDNNLIDLSKNKYIYKIPNKKNNINLYNTLQLCNGKFIDIKI